MALDEPREDDTVINKNGFSFLIDKDLAKQYRHFNIIYQNGFIFKGLRIIARGASYC